MASQLTMEERERISQLRFAGAGPTRIGKEIGRNKSVVLRELSRNSVQGVYSAVAAQNLADKRRRERPVLRKMDASEQQEYVRTRLVKYWSPEQIAGRTRSEEKAHLRVSHATIYRWIKSQGDLRSHWESFLRRVGRRRPKNDRRGPIANQVEIAKRPQIANTRGRIGDWEGDTMVGKGSRNCLVTLVDRKTGFLISGRAANRTARRVTDKIVQLMNPVPGTKRQTLTLDNGKEFASHERLADSLELGVYFARPYCSWERGTNENTNGLLRQFVPKGTDIGEVSHQALADYVDLLNNRPRKRLGYRTPNEVFNDAELCCN